MSISEIRKIRLKNDYQEMVNIRGPILDWKPLKGTAPYIEAYELTVNIRSIIDRGPRYRDRHVIRIELPEGYPKHKPSAIMVSSPIVYHPNWWPRGNWCEGHWAETESLGEFVIRMLRTLQYDPTITNENSPANPDANSWYRSNLSNPDLFPCDRQVLPDPSQAAPPPEINKKIFRISPASPPPSNAKKTFSINGNL